MMRRVGHKGAGLIVPGNTRASFDAALRAGVDMIEFDVLRGADGQLLLAHDPADARRPGVETLQEGLRHLREESYAGIELDVDLKAPGYELEVLEALQSEDLIDRTLLSTQHARSLRVLRAVEPRLRLGLSVPKLQHDPFHHRAAALPALLALGAYRAALPRVAARHLRNGLCDAIMAHWRLATSTLVARVHQAGGELYVWTVDDPARIQALERLGVDGVITNDPRLFTAR